MTTSPQPERSTIDRARAVALWARDTGLGSTGFLVVLVVALAGWSASFIGLHSFGMGHMQLTRHEAWLVPITFDGAPAGLSIVVMRASTKGRSAMLWRVLIVAFTALSSWINYEHIDDNFGRVVACFMPPAAVILFEGLMSEARHAAQERLGGVMQRVHPLRWFFDRSGTLDLYRRHILGLPLPEAMQSAIASPGKSKPLPVGGSQRTAPATLAPPASPATATRAVAATASPEAASPAVPVAQPAASASPPLVYLPPAATATPPPAATPKAVVASRPPAASATPSTGTEQRDLDEIAATYRALRDRIGKAPSDQALADELGVGRSRAQQLRTAAIEAGHTDLAKPLRAAS